MQESSWFKIGFTKAFDDDLLFKTLRERGMRIEADYNKWDKTFFKDRVRSLDSGVWNNIPPSENGKCVVSLDEEKCTFCISYDELCVNNDYLVREGEKLGSVFATIFRRMLLVALKGYEKFIETCKGLYKNDENRRPHEERPVEVPANTVAIDPDFATAWRRERERYPHSELIVLLPVENYLKYYNQYHKDALDRCIEAKYTITIPHCEPMNKEEEFDCGFIFPASAIEILHSFDYKPCFKPFNYKCCIDAQILPTEQVARFKCPAKE